jgi:hypothetical protein
VLCFQRKKQWAKLSPYVIASVLVDAMVDKLQFSSGVIIQHTHKLDGSIPTGRRVKYAMVPGKAENFAPRRIALSTNGEIA